MSLAELFLLLTLLPLPIVLGIFAAYFQKPWWWAALAAVVLVMIATIAPTPEAGQPRVAAGDLVFCSSSRSGWQQWHGRRGTWRGGSWQVGKEGLPRAPRPETDEPPPTSGEAVEVLCGGQAALIGADLALVEVGARSLEPIKRGVT